MWKGPVYPIRPGDKGLFREATDAGLIEGNILQILGTRKGERVMLPLFGSRLLEFIHEPLHEVTVPLIRFDLIEAVKMWEPRVILDKERTKILLFPEEFRVRADLYYFLKTTGTAHQFSVTAERKGGVYRWAG
ncbi:MAG: GPW/gp25 family protein [Synergistaceae bacterium]|jgi:phage baseplate assembly protein W|nr:GPW/gp25 family protein [Synergistaceae bacterium]